MAKHFFNGVIYIDSKTKISDLYVSENGNVCSAEEFESSPTKETIDLQGNCLIPSFRDGHIHPLLGGREALGLDVSKAKTVEELGNLLKEYLAQHPDTVWLDAGTYNRGIVGEQNKETLDLYVDTVPVILHADDHHTIWVNSKALKRAGLTALSIPRYRISGIDVDNKRQPSGILRESKAKDLVLKHAPRRTLEQDAQALLKAESLLIAAGITAVQDAWVDENILNVYKHAEPSLNLTYHLAFSLNQESLDSEFDFIQKAKQSFKDSKIHAHALKIFIDGVFGSATAAVAEPYLSTNETGEINWDKDSLDKALSFARDNGLQAHLHAIGDSAIAFALNSIERTETTNAVIAHAELTNQVIIERIKTLGVTLCVQPYWAQRNDLLQTCLHHLGQDRLDFLYSFRSFLNAGIPLVFSSDWPVSSYKPLEGIATAVFRKFLPEQKIHNEAESISIQEALSAYTTGVTTMLGTEPAILGIGSSFDAVVLSADLMQQDLEGLVSLEVLSVYKGGTRLFPHNQYR